MNNKITGNIGEELAVDYLKKNGCRIMDRNVYIAGGEIDIVAVKDKTIVFIEVKYRSTAKFGTPLESITPAKIKALIKSIRTYVAKHHLYGNDMRIDVIGILGDKIEHIKDAFWIN